jgi:hypothetical protein
MRLSCRIQSNQIQLSFACRAKHAKRMSSSSFASICASKTSPDGGRYHLFTCRSLSRRFHGLHRPFPDDRSSNGPFEILINESNQQPEAAAGRRVIAKEAGIEHLRPECPSRAAGIRIDCHCQSVTHRMKGEWKREPIAESRDDRNRLLQVTSSAGRQQKAVHDGGDHW